MALIRRADAVTATRDALVLDLGDLARQGDAILQHARRRATDVIDEATKERDRLLIGARDSGRTEGIAIGRQEGLAKGRDEGKAAALAEAKPKITALINAWTAALECFSVEREMLMAEARQDILQLAIEIAARITRRTIALDPTVIETLLHEVLSAVAKPTRARISVHPDDEKLANDLMPALLQKLSNIRDVEISADPEVHPGSCILRTDTGASINADIGAQLDRIAAVLLPERKPQ